MKDKLNFLSLLAGTTSVGKILGRVDTSGDGITLGG